jgi:putative oxidoreductase
MMFSDLLAGYAITDKGHGNYKLPLIYLVLMLPLIFHGAGKLSLDALFDKFVLANGERRAVFEPFTVGAFAVAVGLPAMMLLPKVGLALTAAGAVLAGGTLWLRR